MITKEKKEMLLHYNTGLSAYKQRRWEDAIHAFEKALAIDPQDGPSIEYLNRSRDFKQTPPSADWDGVYTMKTK